MGPKGNTNFAIVHDLTTDGIYEQLTGTPDDPESRGPGGIVDTILANNQYWLVDLGPETMLRICQEETGAAVRNLQGVIITHAHADHSGGLASLAWRTFFVEKTRPVLVFAEECEEMLHHQLVELSCGSSPGLLRQLDREVGLRDFFLMHAMARGGGGVSYFGPLAVRRMVASHNIWRAEDGHIRPFPGVSVSLSFAGDGGKVLFSGDTAVPISGVDAYDLTLHDCQFYLDPPDGNEVHCPYSLLKDAVAPAVRDKIWLSHTEVPESVFKDGFRWASKDTILILDKQKVEVIQAPGNPCG